MVFYQYSFLPFTQCGKKKKLYAKFQKTLIEPIFLTNFTNLSANRFIVSMH